MCRKILLLICVVFSFKTSALTLEAKLNAGSRTTDKIRQAKEDDCYDYHCPTEGRYEHTFSRMMARYDYDNHLVRFEIPINWLERYKNNESYHFEIDTTVYRTGKSEYEPKYNYEFSFNPRELFEKVSAAKDSLENDAELAIVESIEPYKIRYCPRHDGGCWRPTWRTIYEK